MTDIRTEQHSGYRVYIINGKKYLSVTSVLGQAIQMRKKHDPEFAEKMRIAGDFGDRFHRLTYDADRGIPVEKLKIDNPEMTVMLCAWKTWVDANIKEWILLEEVVWSPSLGVAGRLDRVGRYRNEELPVLIDIKTGRPGGADQQQQWLYKRGLWESRKIKIGRCLLVYISKNDPGIINIRECNGMREQRDLIEIKEKINDFYNSRGGKV